MQQAIDSAKSAFPAWRNTPPAKRAQVMHEWHKALLHAEIPPLIEQWERRLGVRVSAYFLQRMKTKWGSCRVCNLNCVTAL